MDVEPKIGVVNPPKMDGENGGKPYEQMDDLGGTTIFGNTHIFFFFGSRGSYQTENQNLMMHPWLQKKCIGSTVDLSI